VVGIETEEGLERFERFALFFAAAPADLAAGKTAQAVRINRKRSPRK